MSKDKKRDESKKPKKISVEAEVSLLGLLLAIASIVGLLNQGWLGSFLTYCLVFLFGSMYFVILLLNIYLGLFLFFKKKKPSIILGVNALALIFLLAFLLIASSEFDGASLNNWYAYFNDNFKDIVVSSFKVDVDKTYAVGGGLIGYGSYTLLVSLTGEFVAKVVILLVVLGCLYILLKKPVSIILSKVKEFIKKRKEKKEDKKEKVVEGVDDFNDDVISNQYDQIKVMDTSNSVNEHDEKIEIDNSPSVSVFAETFNENNFGKINNQMNNYSLGKNSENKSDNKKNGLTFDIFNEAIFDEEENDVLEEIYDNKSLNEENVNVYTEVHKVEENVKEFNEVNDEAVVLQEEVSEDDIEFSDEGLEFFGEEELVKEEMREENIVVPNIPFVEENVKVEEKKIVKDDFKEIDDIYSLLKENNENNAYIELKDEVEINCEKINQKLNELNIKASVNNYIIGPCVTRYEIVPEIGVRVSSIVNIENDLKLALAEVKTRMEAPIPGKSAVGIEVANKKRYPVYLKEVILPFKDDDSKLLVGIGRDLNNNEIVLNIDKMPHLLVAGATGSGKSVCINSMIVSLLLRTTPDEVKMILIDPKKVEMLPYANMPHLLCPVVIDPKKASVALKKVVKEMDKRYDEFANNGVRNIEGYNKLMKERGEVLLPNIVVIIDELADLMLVAAKEVEESIQRITQLARAAGIYLIVATQRPSVDVITGVIKANIPSRIAFSVSSQIDSRTIIDRGGAEELLGKGDMLMDISGSGTLNRVQGVYVSDEEIFSVVNYVKSKFNVNFNEEFLNLEEEKKEELINNLSINEDTNNDDALYEDIKDFVIRNQRASTSLLQRYFTLGYARAARMMDRLEMDGVISGANGAKPREVLMKYEREDNGNE